MNSVKLWALSLSLAATLGAVDRKTLFLDRMQGFESYIERAIHNMELDRKVDLVEEAEHPELKAMLGNRFTSVYAEALFQKQTGRTEDTRITVIDVKTRKQLLVFDFKMGADEAAKQKSANDFVRKFQSLIEKKQ